MVTQNVEIGPAVNFKSFSTKFNLPEMVEAILLRDWYLRAVYVRQIVERDVKRQVGADFEDKLSKWKLFESDAALLKLADSIKWDLKELLAKNPTL